MRISEFNVALVLSFASVAVVACSGADPSVKKVSWNCGYADVPNGGRALECVGTSSDALLLGTSGSAGSTSDGTPTTGGTADGTTTAQHAGDDELPYFN